MRTKISIIPAVAALAALFMVLPSRPTGVEVKMVAGQGRYRFVPDEVNIRVGQAVTFVNDSRATHTATCDGCPWDTGPLQPGQFRTLRFDAPMKVTFYCRYHGVAQQMFGTLRVAQAG